MKGAILKFGYEYKIVTLKKKVSSHVWSMCNEASVCVNKPFQDHSTFQAMHQIVVYEKLLKPLKRSRLAWNSFGYYYNNDNVHKSLHDITESLN